MKRTTPSIYIFEAGSTKTDLLIYSNHNKYFHTLSGFNPNRMDTSFIEELSNLNIQKNAIIHFYGSGVSGEKSIKQISTLFKQNKIEIESDITGAARACLQNGKGVVCILGTGAIAAYYDGHIIKERKGGYGYLIDDTGGGLELSKIIISNWLNNSLSKNTTIAIENHFKISTHEFINVFYSKKDLHHLASVCCILPALAKSDEHLNLILLNYFETFIQRHVKPLADKYCTSDIHLVGSISEYFAPWITKSALLFDLNVIQIIKKPINKILDFHL
jgi:N-acetylglucosamine kinase-like BadF-type ATPase